MAELGVPPVPRTAMFLQTAAAGGRLSTEIAEGSYLVRRERTAPQERDERLERFVVDRLTEG